MRPALKEVRPLNGCKLDLRYSNGEHKVYDLAKLLKNPMNHPLKNPTLFETVKINGCGVEWRNGIDICPDELYNNSRAAE